MPDSYNLTQVEKVTTKRFGFDLFSAAGYKWKYVDIAFEERSALLTRQLAKGIRTFVDVGAHYGFYSVLVGLSNQEASILAFEPVEENFEILNKNISLNNIEATTYKTALSNVEGQSPFQISEQSSQSGFTANPDERVLKTINVDVDVLDHYRPLISEDHVMVKIDTEGNELNVLDGMQDLVRNVKDIRLLIEFNPSCLLANRVSPEQLLNRIDSLGFDIFVVHDVEMRIQKYDLCHEWQGIMGERSYRNLYCLKKEKSLSLCLFSHSSFLAGAERSLLELTAKLISGEGTVCTVILPDDGPLKKSLDDIGANTIVCKYDWWCSLSSTEHDQIRSTLHDSYENLVSKYREIATTKPDVIVTNTIVIPWGALTAYDFGLPHIWWIKEYGEMDHGLKFYFDFQQILDTIRQFSSHVVVNSQAVKDALFKGAENSECTVAYNNVALMEAEPVNELVFGYPTSTKLLVLGSITRSKGQDDAVNAAIRLLDEGQDVELCLMGVAEGTFLNDLKELVRYKQREDRVHFHGFVSNVRPFLEQADLVLTCSKNEAFGRGTAEAMLMGKPVIGTKSGGTAELIEDGIDGFLYTSGDVAQLMERIAFFLNRPDKVQEFGRRACIEISSKLSARPADAIIYRLSRTLKGASAGKGTRLFFDCRHICLDGLSSKIADRYSLVSQLHDKTAQQDRRINDLEREVKSLNGHITKISSSWSWWFTSPMRAIGRLAGRIIGGDIWSGRE